MSRLNRRAGEARSLGASSINGTNALMTEPHLRGIEKFSSAITESTQPIVEKILGEVNREKAIEVMGNILFDEPGERYFGLTPSPKENLLRKILSGFVEIESTFEVLRDIPFYLMRFPSKHPQVSKTRFLNYHVGNYFNEIYILRERLRSYQRVIARIYKNDPRLKETRKHIEKFELLVSSFDDIVSLRGKHVHQKRYGDEDFERLNLYEHSANLDDPIFNRIYPLALREYRKKWLKTFSENNNTVKIILDAYFEILYDVVFDKDGNWLEPSNSA